ncbi:GSCOCG00005964001-RA-CDS [Cotesia congregata]|uniref:Protein sleepless n=1 Tax=Cotesia congregata TaxID=51543 RepID=A0A8J2HLI9_COTCN|nr:GSCOCG00005964001-RA-CDS [Cotesia congregata]CAG5106468.1 Protein of unknown function [Cotesia congregata]
MISRQVVSTLLSIVVFISFISYGDAVVCYECNSAFDPRCGDPFDPYSLGTVNCSFQERLEHINNIEPTICRKISQKVYGKVRVVRGCGFITDVKDDADCVRRTGTHDVMAYYCSCTTDLCNSSNYATPTFGLLLSIFSIVYILTTD